MSRGQSKPAIIGKFLEMLSAERGASANTLDAYSRDLANFASFVHKRDRALELRPPRTSPISLR